MRNSGLTKEDELSNRASESPCWPSGELEEEGSASIARFVLLGHQRSGSSLIISTLRRHPQVMGFGELFNIESAPARIGFNVEGYDNFSDDAIRYRNRDPLGFLSDVIYKRFSEEVKAIGFKLFPEQIDDPRFRILWNWLERNRQLKIIYIKRRNLLDTFVSLKLARLTGIWNSKVGSNGGDCVINIDHKECSDFFEQRLAYDQKISQLLAGREARPLIYEDIVHRIDDAMQQLHEFLGISVIKGIKPHLRKLNKRKMSEIIGNYDELKERLSQKWLNFFD